MADLVIRNATIVDGTGSPSRRGDVAVTGEHITEVADRIESEARRDVDADGLVLTPGFVDIHTHYDGQVTWDPVVAPSSLHGVTSAVMGNCGVSFAPAKPTDADHDWLIGLLEGVEDIPGTALAEGLPWDWETFPDYLDALDRRRWTIDIGAQVSHAPLRAYVMGTRGADPHEAPSADELTQMHRLVREGIEAGALGFTTSRTLLHRAIDGEPVPGTFATADELLGIGRVLGELGRGVIELASDLMPEDPELAWMERLSIEMAVRKGTHQPEHVDDFRRIVRRCVSEA